MKRLLLLVLCASPLLGMQRELKLDYSNHAKQKIQNLKVPENEIQEVIKNGDRFTDKKHPNAILYAQRSPYPREESEREYDQLVVVLGKEPVEGKNKVVTVYYNEGALRPYSKQTKQKSKQK